MAKKVTRDVVINTTVTGLDEAKKKMDSLSAPAVLSLDDKTNKKLLKEREAIMKEIAALQQKGGGDEQEIANLEKRVQNFTRSAAKELIKGMGQAGSGFKEDILESLEALEKNEKELEAAQLERKEFERQFDTGLEGDTVEPKTDKAYYEMIDAGRKSLEDQNILTEEMTKKNKSQQHEAQTLVKYYEQINERLEKRGTTLDQEIEKYIKTGKVSKELEETIEEQNKTRGRAIPQEE